MFCASTDQARKEMREACFEYLSLGGVCSTGPVALLSGLKPQPLSLVLHFFAVAVYGVGRLLLPFPTPQRLWAGVRLILVSSCNLYKAFYTDCLSVFHHVFTIHLFTQNMPAYLFSVHVRERTYTHKCFNIKNEQYLSVVGHRHLSIFFLI